MTDSPHHKPGSSRNTTHGTVGSYIVGFVLSLIFTFIPYYLVVNQTVTGTVLLATIIGFAMLQMIIQITFFLHLGRGPKPNWNLIFYVSTFAIVLLVVGGSIMIINNLHYNMSPSDKLKKIANDEAIYQVGGKETGACSEIHENHIVTISDGLVSPMYTYANKCDTLTFINEDEKAREITFGTHPGHGVYAGETELLVKKGRSETINLSDSGSYEFHDHLDPNTTGYFTVEP